MAGEMRTVQATCLCGSAKHDIVLPASDFPLESYICHCSSCRRMTGTLCLVAVSLPREYRPSQALLYRLQAFNFAKLITLYFCPQCGTQMLSRYLENDSPESAIDWSIAAGTLEQADGVFEVETHNWIADTLDGGLSDFLPTVGERQMERWPHHYGQGEELPLFWQSPTRPQVQPSASDGLKAHCKCGGIGFYITRPSARSALGKASWPDVIIPFNSVAPKLDDRPWWLRDGGKKYLAGVCSCNSCRLACGMEWVQWAFVPTLNITLDAEGKEPFTREFGTLKHYRSSNRATRHFCGTCGATVFWDGDERPQIIDVAVGLLDATEGVRAESWLEWETKRLSYREDAMPRAERLTLGVEAGLKAYAKKYQGETKG